jgi:hypothetical protein
MDGRTAARAFSNDGLFFLEKFLVFLGKEWIGFHKLLCHCFNALHEVLRVGVSLCNQRQRIFPFRSQFRGSQIVRQDADKVDTVFCREKPEFTSFSMTAARVAGVPNPLRSASAFVSSLPACSIADKRLASVWGFGGCVSWAVTFAEKPENVCPSVKSGTSDTKSLSPSSASGFPFSVRR